MKYKLLVKGKLVEFEGGKWISADEILANELNKSCNLKSIVYSSYDQYILDPSFALVQKVKKEFHAIDITKYETKTSSKKHLKDMFY